MSKTDTEQLILDAAKKIFIKKGYDGARMQEIADEAAINKAMLHYYFRSKDDLFGKIIENAVQVMTAAMIPSFKGDGSVMEKLAHIVDKYIDTALENPHIPLFLLSEIARGQDRYQKRIKSILIDNQVLPHFFQEIRQEQEMGLIKPIEPHQIILTVMSLMAFPFISKPVFTDLLEVKEIDFASMMMERKKLIVDILNNSFAIK